MVRTFDQVRRGYWVIALVMGVLIGALVVDQATAAPEQVPPAGTPAGDPVNVTEQNLDADGYIAVHEQGVVPVKNEDGGTLNVTGTVSVLKEPVNLFAQITASTSGGIGEKLRIRGETEDFVVPDGKQLVVEYVSLETFDHVLTGSQAYSAYLGWRFVSNRNFAGRVTADTSFTGFGPESGELVAIRVPAGETPEAVIFSNFDTLVNVSVLGYLELMP